MVRALLATIGRLNKVNQDTPTTLLMKTLQREGLQVRCRILLLRGERIAHVVLQNNKQTDIRLLRIVERVVVQEIEEKTGTYINHVFWSYQGEKVRRSANTTLSSKRQGRFIGAMRKPPFARTTDAQLLLSCLRTESEDDEVETFSDLDLDRWEMEIRDEISKTQTRDKRA